MEHRRISKYGNSWHHVITINTGGYSGCAPLGGRRLIVRAPPIETKDWKWNNSDGRTVLHKEPVEFDSVNFAHTVMHELAHNRGIDHKDMHEDLKCRDKEGMFKVTGWAKGFEVRPQEDIPKKNAVDARKERAIKNVKLYQSKLKRTQNLLKKWEKKVRYYQKKEVKE